MKKFILIALTVAVMAVVALMASSCSLGRLFREETHREQARIYMNDGTVLSGRAVLPNLESKYLYLYPDRGLGKDSANDGSRSANGGRKRLKASDIRVAEFWDKKHPEVHNSFIYSDFIKGVPAGETRTNETGSKTSAKGRQRGPFWMKLAGSGKHLDICLCGAYYSFDDKGNIQVEAASGDNVYIIGFKAGGEGQFVDFANTSASSLRRNLIDWLSDDPVLCGRLHDRSVTAKDFETICAEYSPRAEAVEKSAI